jgi:hypothetical protein
MSKRSRSPLALDPIDDDDSEEVVPASKRARVDAQSLGITFDDADFVDDIEEEDEEEKDEKKPLPRFSFRPEKAFFVALDYQGANRSAGVKRTVSLTLQPYLGVEFLFSGNPFVLDVTKSVERAMHKVGRKVFTHAMHKELIRLLNGRLFSIVPDTDRSAGYALKSDEELDLVLDRLSKSPTKTT